MKERAFLLSTLVDFPDDCSRIAFDEDLLTQLMDRLQWMGVRRVYWNHYNTGMWKWFIDYKTSGGTRQTLENLGDPMPVGRRLAHERGMEFIAVIKPYETGATHATPKSTLAQVGVVGLLLCVEAKVLQKQNAATGKAPSQRFGFVPNAVGRGDDVALQ